MKPLALGATGVAILLLLSGCFFGGGASTGSGGTGGDGQSGSGGDNGTNDGGTSTTPPGDVELGDFEGLPSTFPTSEVPLVDGDIPIGIDVGTGWSVIVKVADFNTAFAEASDKLTGAGFDSQAENVTAQGSIGVFTNGKYQVNITASENPDYGPSLNYVVVKLG